MNKLLLVRLSSMGDLIHTLPAITDLAKNRPHIELHWLCEQSFADIARLHPFVKKVQLMQWRTWRKKIWLSSVRQEIGCLQTQLKNEQYDVVLDSQGLLKSALFGKMAGVEMIGLDRVSARESLAACFYQRKIHVPKGVHAVWRNRDLFAQAFGYEVVGQPDFGIHRLPENEWVLDDEYCVALHATSRESKLWPVEHWLQLLTYIHQHYQFMVWLPWGNEQEKKRAEYMASKLSFARVCSKLTLFQAAYLLQKARVVVGVDTGLLHLANAVDTALVGIYTDSNPVKTGVQPSAWAMNVGDVGQTPTVAQVALAVEQVLKLKA